MLNTDERGQPQFGGRYGFIAWNEFQLKHFSGLLRRVKKPAIILVKDRASVDFIQLAQLIEQTFDATVVQVKEVDIPILDGLFDGIFSQTDFKSSRKFKKTPLYALQYSMTKESHQYGAWHIFFRAAFCYGRYSADRVRYACAAFACGHPRLSRTGKDISPELLARYREELDPAKRTILYAPTWGLGGRVEDFMGQMEWMSERFNVIIRPHHNTRSRELHRFGAIRIPDCPPLEDDFVTQVGLADVVISDYSGVAFDSLYLGKPVVLFRDESIALERSSSYSPESIEVARVDDIGPVAVTCQDLKDLLEDEEFKFKAEYAERNSRLLDECFSTSPDVPGAILGTVESGVQFEEPVHREWIRSFVGKKEAAARRSNGKSHKKSPTRSPKRAVGSRKIVVRRPTVLRRMRSRLGESLRRHRWLYVKYLVLMSKVRRRGYREAAAEILAGIGEPRAASRLLGSVPMDTLSDKFFHLWIKDPGNRLNRRRAAEFEEIFDLGKLSFTARMRRAVCLSDPGFLAKLISDSKSDLASDDLNVAVSAVGALERMRCYEALRAGVVDRPRLLEMSSVRSTLSRIEAIESSLGELVGESRAAADSLSAAYRNESSDVSIYLPQHFFSANKAMAKKREKNWALVRDTYLSLFRSLRATDAVRFSTRHQFFLNMVEEEADKPVLSFFTKGGGRGNWHLKELGLSHFVSIDPDGFLGSSILGTLPMEVVDFALSSLTPAHGIFEELQLLLNEHGGDKYGASAVKPVEPEGYIFVALQSTKGLEDTYQPIDMLIRTLMRFSRQTGTRVVFKRHPLCEDTLVTSALLDAIRIPTISVSRGDTWALVRSCSAVVTVNSGVGLQAVVAKKPLVLTGPSEVQVVARRAHSIDEIPAILRSVRPSDVHVDAYARFLTFYFKHYLVDANDGARLVDRLGTIVEVTRASTTKEEVRRRYFDLLIAQALQIENCPPATRPDRPVSLGPSSGGSSETENHPESIYIQR